LIAAIVLKEFVAMMKITGKGSFMEGLSLWFLKQETFLNERTVNTEIGKSHYGHERLKALTDS
jgi:hypothetical protein